MSKKDITCKVVLVGSSGVGKTCIIKRYLDGSYDPESEPTLTTTYCHKKLNFPKYKKSISFDIWDTSGQDYYRTIAKNFYQNASIGILVYDITRRNTFEDMKSYWYEELKASGEENMVFAVAGNKSDLFKKEEVKEEEGKEYAKSINAIFMLTSCAENLGIEELFNECGIKYLESNSEINTEQKTGKFVLQKKEAVNNNNQKNNKCC